MHPSSFFAMFGTHPCFSFPVSKQKCKLKNIKIYHMEELFHLCYLVVSILLLCFHFSKRKKGKIKQMVCLFFFPALEEAVTQEKKCLIFRKTAKGKNRVMHRSGLAQWGWNSQKEIDTSWIKMEQNQDVIMRVIWCQRRPLKNGAQLIHSMIITGYFLCSQSQHKCLGRGNGILNCSFSFVIFHLFFFLFQLWEDSWELFFSHVTRGEP